MALNEIYVDANELSLPVAEGTVSGDLVQVGELVGVALADAKAGEDGEFYATVKLSGAFKLDTAATFAEGDKVYVSTAGAVTATDTDKLVGHALKAGSGYVVVRLAQN